MRGSQAIAQRENIDQMKVKLKDVVRRSVSSLELIDTLIEEDWFARLDQNTLDLTT